MPQVTARIPDYFKESLDRTVSKFKRLWAEIIRQALESYIEDFEDISIAIDSSSDPSDETSAGKMPAVGY